MKFVQLLLISVFVFPIVLAGCTQATLIDVGDKISSAGKQALESADSFEILTLHPEPKSMEQSTDPEAEYLGNYRILGRKKLDSSMDQLKLIELIYKGIAESDGKVAACFNPRHGIIASKGSHKVELIICFECLSMQCFENGKHSSITTTSLEKAKVNKIYRSHSLKIAK